MTPLDRIIGLETQQEILALLTPKQLAITALVWDGMSYEEIAHEFGVTEQAVGWHIRSARRKILHRFPELETWASDRYISPTRNGRGNNDH